MKVIINYHLKNESSLSFGFNILYMSMGWKNKNTNEGGG